MQLQNLFFLENEYKKLSSQFLDTQVPMFAYARVFMCMQMNTKNNSNSTIKQN